MVEIPKKVLNETNSLELTHEGYYGKYEPHYPYLIGIVRPMSPCGIEWENDRDKGIAIGFNSDFVDLDGTSKGRIDIGSPKDYDHIISWFCYFVKNKQPNRVKRIIVSPKLSILSWKMLDNLVKENETLETIELLYKKNIFLYVPSENRNLIYFLLKNKLKNLSDNRIDLSGCNIGLFDFGLFENLLNLIKEKSITLLDLSNNNLTFNVLRKILEILYDNKKKSSTIKEIILRNNLIEIDHIRKLDDLYRIFSKNENLNSIDLSGNLIFSEKRNEYLLTVLNFLLNKSNLPVGEFLTLKFHSLKKLHNNSYSLELKKENEEIIELNLNYSNLQSFNRLKEIIKESTDSDVFEYMISQGIGKRILEIDEDLKNKKYNVLDTHEEKIYLVKKLIDYHPQAPLKSYVNTHSIFCHSPFTKAQSLLCPKEQITHEMGRVFLMAKIPKGQLDEHAMLAYEFINGYNQRFFKVAHLTAVSSKKFFGHSTPEISFFVMGIDELVSYLQEKFSITSFPVNRKQIKNMHAAIVEDVKELKDTKYKFMISTSSQSKEDSDIKIKNCLTWAWDKIKDHAGYQINVTLSMYPSIAVKWLINNPDKLSMQGKMTVDMIDGKSNVLQQNPNENCLMM